MTDQLTRDINDLLCRKNAIGVSADEIVQVVRKSAETPERIMAPNSSVRGYRLGKPYRTADMPGGKYAYAVKMRIDPHRGIQVRLEFESLVWKHKQWHDAHELINS
jgi:hypothetical protein